jgi:tripartite-type tricarboxylate transporter receptor subunit TctC
MGQNEPSKHVRSGGSFVRKRPSRSLSQDRPSAVASSKREESDEDSAASISKSSSGCCRAAGGTAYCKGANLSVTAGAFCCRRPPGGPLDILARLMGQWLSERLGQPFVIDNRPGAGTNIGTEAVVRALADGHMLLMIGMANAINATLYEKLNFNFIRDIAPVAGIMPGPQIMVVNLAVPAKTVPEFIAYAKANPGKINMASAGNGTSFHVAGELFKMMAGVNMVHIPYRGSAPALTDLLGGQVQVMFPGPADSIEFIRAGKLRALAVTTATRSEMLPDIPTVSEFLPGYETSQWFGLGAPTSTPAEIVDKLNKGINAALADPSPVCRLGRHGASRFARRLRQAHRRGNREVGQGGEVCGHQAGVINPCGFAVGCMAMTRVPEWRAATDESAQAAAMDFARRIVPFWQAELGFRAARSLSHRQPCPWRIQPALQ